MLKLAIHLVGYFLIQIERQDYKSQGRHDSNKSFSSVWLLNKTVEGEKPYRLPITRGPRLITFTWDIITIITAPKF